jgi:hypothetical protein
MEELALRFVLGAGVLAAAIYALLPSEQGRPLTPHDATEDSGPASKVPEPTPTLDLAEFNLDLWVEPPPPPPERREQVRVEAPPPPPPSVDLIAITRDNETRQAVFFDNSNGRLITVSAGGSIGPYRIEFIDPVSVRLTHAGRTIRVDLDQPRIAGTITGDRDE